MPTPFAALYEATAPSTPEGRRYAVDTVWSGARFDAVLGRVVVDMARAPSEASMALVVLRPNAVETPGDAAFSCDGRIFGALYAIWEDAGADRANIGWLRAAIDRLTPMCTGAYVGEADLERQDRTLPTLSPAVQARLAGLCAAHDPEGLFLRRLQTRAIAAE